MVLAGHGALAVGGLVVAAAVVAALIWVVNQRPARGPPEVGSQLAMAGKVICAPTPPIYFIIGYQPKTNSGCMKMTLPLILG